MQEPTEKDLLKIEKELESGEFFDEEFDDFSIEEGDFSDDDILDY